MAINKVVNRAEMEKMLAALRNTNLFEVTETATTRKAVHRASGKKVLSAVTPTNGSNWFIRCVSSLTCWLD